MDKRERVEVLLVEDDPAHLDLALIAIEQANKANGKEFVVTVARDGEEGLKLLQGGYHPDLILLDLRLPKLSGRELLHLIKKDERWTAIPVIILTTSNLEEDIVGVYRDHATAYLVKPLRLAPLVDTMSRLKRFFTNPQLRLSER